MSLFRKRGYPVFDCSIQRTYFKTFMQKVQETEAANQDLAVLEASRRTPTVSRVAERLALLKDVFVHNRTPQQVGLGNPPYRKKELPKTNLLSSLFRWFRVFPRRKRCRSSRSNHSNL